MHQSQGKCIAHVKSLIQNGEGCFYESTTPDSLVNCDLGHVVLYIRNIVWLGLILNWD